MNKNLLSPLGEAIFPHLTIANVKFNPDGDYGVNLRLTEEKAKKMQAEIKEVLAVELPIIAAKNKVDLSKAKFAAHPWHPSLDKNKTVIPGFIDFKISQKKVGGSGEKKWIFTPAIFDNYNKPWDFSKEIGFGSKVVVAYQVYCWYAKGEVGFSLKLKAVQVKEYVANERTAQGFGFEADEGAPETTDDEIQKEFQKPVEVKQLAEDKDTPIAEDDFMAQLTACVKK